MKNKKIVVVGSYLVALVMNTKRLPVLGETVMAKNFRQVHGGKGSNQAVQAARLGAATSFIGRVGNDHYGAAFLQLCKSENINTDFVFQSDSLPTGAGFVICDENGHNIISIDIAAINEFDCDDIQKALEIITDNTTVLIQLEIPLATALYAAKKAKEKGAIVILNPAPAQNLTGYDLSMVDILTPNETEARICLGLSQHSSIKDQEAAKGLLSFGCANVIATLGEKGSYMCNSDSSVFIPGFRMNEVIDTTGAGDAFNAGLAVALSEGKDLIEAIRFANAVGGLSVTKMDTISAYHCRNEVDAFLEHQQVSG